MRASKATDPIPQHQVLRDRARTATSKAWLSLRVVVLVAFTQATATQLLWGQPMARPPLTIAGTLVDEGGAQAAGTEVVLRPYPSNYEQHVAHLAERGVTPSLIDGVRTGAGGSFSLVAPGVGPWRLEIGAERPAGVPHTVVSPLYYPLLAVRTPVALEPIELPARHPLEVRVVDATGQPVQGALVVADPAAQHSQRHTHPAAHEQPQRLYPSFGRAVARTDNDGLARFLMPTSEAIIVVSAKGYAPRAGKVGSRRVVLELRRGLQVTLRVRAPRGEEAPGIVVRTREPYEAPMAITDENGEATVDVPADQGVAFVFEGADGAFAEVIPQAWSSAEGHHEDRILDVRLERPVSIQGRIAEAQADRGVPGAAVWLSSDPGRHVFADAAGVFSLNAPNHRDGASLAIAAAGFLTATADVGAVHIGDESILSVALHPAAPLRGWIVDDFDQPLAGANVWAEVVGRERFPGRHAGGFGRATSATDGSFWIPTIRYGETYRLIAEAEHYAPVRRELPPFARSADVEPVRIVLSKGRQPWGTVVDLDGSLVTHAQVRLLWAPGELDFAEPFLMEDATGMVASNDRGEFEFQSVAPGQYFVSVSHPEYADLRERPVDVPHGEGYFDLGVLAMTPGAEIHGVVLDPSRRPVSGADVNALQRGRGLSSQTRHAVTNADGSFRLAGLLPVPATLTATADGYVPAVVESATPATGEPILIELAEGASLVGQVLQPDGRAAAGVGVSLTLPAGALGGLSPRPSGEHMFRRVLTDNDGRFRFDSLTPATWFAEARDESRRATLDGIRLVPGEPREIELRLQTLNRLTVHVTSRTGKPVASAAVKASFEIATEPTVIRRTDAAGRVVLAVGTGTARVEVSHADLLALSREVVIQPGNNELHVQLEPGWQISGTVRSIDGAPIPGAVVEAGEPMPGELGSEFAAQLRRLTRLSQPAAQAVSDASGSFRLTGLDDGRFRLVARVPGYAASESVEAVTINGQSVAGVEILLAPGASVRGNVVGLGPSEMASTEIEAWRDVLFRSASPDPEGSFELSGLAPGIWRIAAVTGGRRTAEHSVTLEAGAMETAVELRFEPGFRLAGQVLIADEPASGAFISALLSEHGRQWRTRADHLGRFEIEGLPAGAYELDTRHRGVTQNQPLELRADHYNLVVYLPPRPDR